MKKLLQLLYLLSITGAVLLFATGCMSLFKQQPYVAVKYYDLGTPPEITLEKVQIKFIPFNSTEPVKYKMVYHDTNCEVVIDDYNKWIQPPCLLLTRYLQSAFKQNGITSEDSELIISGNIFMFRIDLLNNKVSLGVSYVIKKSSDDMITTTLRNSNIFSSKLKAQGPENFVRAMNKCARELVLLIAKDIKKIQQHNSAKEKQAAAGTKTPAEKLLKKK